MPDDTDNGVDSRIDEFKRLVFRRGQLKATLTRFTNFLNSPNPGYTSLKLRVKDLDTTWAEFQDIQSKIEELDSKQDVERQSFEDNYYSSVAIALDLIEQQEHNVVSSAGANLNVSQPAINNNNNAKLQSISLPQFSGSYEGWIQFYEVFQALVDKNSDLTKIQKFYYLQSCLRGEATQVLQSLEICEANYDEALKLLRERYENKRMLIHNHVRNLFEMSSVSRESHQNLRKLIDSVVRNLRALTSLGQPVDQWDTLIIYLISQKLDNHTRKEWEVLNNKDSPMLDELLNFLKNKCQVLETIDNKQHHAYEKAPQNRSTVAHVNTGDSTQQFYQNSANQGQFNNFYCYVCKEKNHYTYKCPKLLALSCKDRYLELKRLGICTNCLRSGHNNENCTGKTCRICKRKHNSILHDSNFQFNRNTPYNNNNTFTAISPTNVSSENTVNLENSEQGSRILQMSDQNYNSTRQSIQELDSSLQRQCTLTSINTGANETVSNATASSAARCHNTNSSGKTQILLATAIVNIIDTNGKALKCRALLDSASQSNFCSEALYQKLNLPGCIVNVPVLGVGGASCNVSVKVKTTIKALNDSFQAKAEFLIINKITTKLPQISFDPTFLNLPENIQLADSDFCNSNEIDILIGTELFFRCLNDQKIMLGEDAPILQNTKFGWVLVGPLNLYRVPKEKYHSHCFLNLNESYENLHNTIQKFWQIENVGSKQDKLTNEELECELDFRNNHKIETDGRYTVKLPLKQNYVELGESYSIALKCLLSLERRLEKNIELKTQYTDFLKEYEKMGHMSRINPDLDLPGEICVYLSHHAVIRESSSTTKLRVVFNASLKTNSGYSLNDVLKIGPKVQKDVFDMVLRLRTYPILIVADIEKMYRMIWIDKSHRKLQRILWRDDVTGNVVHYELNTVTYGTASASFLATRVLHDIGLKYKDLQPEVSKIILNNFYMDDLIFGHHDLDKAIELKANIDKTLSKHGLQLRKWVSNNPRVIKKSDDSQNTEFYILGDDETKTLGTAWNTKSDTIHYNFQLKIDLSIITKRTILATIGQLYDILGLINPVIVTAKLILQEVWKSQLDWDSPVPAIIADQWSIFVNQLPKLNSIHIPRCVIDTEISHRSVLLCGFSDASQLAYGACIYLVSCDNSNKPSSHLICSKSRLAPLSSMSLPRLELCGALLLAQLVDKVLKSLEIHIPQVNLFTDSMIVLDWLNSEPSRWKVFVSNRVAEIQRLTANMTWYHIESDINPADIVSRGSDPVAIQTQPLWWHGPPFLLTDCEQWPKCPNVKIALHEARKQNMNLSFSTVKQIIGNPNEIFFRWSSYNTLIRVIAHVYRWSHNARNKEKLSGPLSTRELDSTIYKICKLVQIERFSEEIRCLQNSQVVPKNSRILSLNPFIDEQGLLRVGGRLINSNLNFERKHAIILPSKHAFVQLLINHYHRKFLHAGPSFILNQIRDKFWIITGRNEVRKVLRKCVICFRIKPSSPNQLMGALPKPRVVPSRPFSHCGIDYAGPYCLKDGKTRNRVTIKAYICVFICFSTRAVHAELVTDLSSEAFLNAFKRFVSRRGLCQHIFSDNATNFVGANRELLRLCQVVRDCVSNKYSNYFSDHRINWHFIPARSPHHGGIWESAVRSFKYHLKRVIGDNHLNFEQFYTLLTQVEAILNSRPILPLSNDPTDIDALTPGHFLIGESLVAVPQSHDSDIPTNRLRQYKQLQKLAQRFWSLWSKDYLNTLQQRAKWKTRQENIKIGTLVLLKEENEPPLHWPMGRIVAVHPGADKLVRVVSVRTKKGVLSRAITKICPLPITDNGSDC